MFAPAPTAPIGGMDAGQATLDAIMDGLPATATQDEIAVECARVIVREIQRPKRAETVMQHLLKWRPLLDYIARAGRLDLFALVLLEFAERMSAHPTIRAGRLPAIMEMETGNVRQEK